MDLLMISSDNSIARGKRGVFYHMLQEYSKHWGRIDVIAPRAAGAVETTVHGNVTVHPGDVPKPLQPYFILKKGTEIYRRSPFDLINIQTYPYFYNDLGGRLLHRRLGVPYMLDLLHVIGHPRAVDLDERVRRVLTRLYFTYFARGMLGIPVINHREVPDFLRRCGVPADKIHPLPCFYIDFDVFRPLDPSLRSRAGLPKTGRRVLYAGRLAKNKGLFELLDAFRQVVDQVPDAELVILGGGVLEGRLRRRVQALNLNDHVVFRGHVPHTEVGRVYNECDLLVMPSFNEGGPRVVLEAMACGTAVLTTPVGITHEVVRDGVNGMFIDWDPEDIAEKIVYLLRNPEVRERLAAAGPAAVQGFEYSQMIRNLATTYQALVRGDGR